MELSLLLGTILFWSFIVFICLKYGIPPSISDSWYLLDENNRWMFTGMMFSTASIAAVCSDSGWMMLAAFLLALVGVAANFRNKWDKPIHFFGAYGSGIVSLSWIGFGLERWDILLWFVICAAIAWIYLWKKRIFWIECLCFLATFVALWWRVLR